MATEYFHHGAQDTAGFCPICLSRGRNLYVLEDGLSDLTIVLDIFNKESSKQAVCWECRAIIRRIARFKQTAMRAQKILREQSYIGIQHISLSKLKEAQQEAIIVTEKDVERELKEIISSPPYPASHTSLQLPMPSEPSQQTPLQSLSQPEYPPPPQSLFSPSAESSALLLDPYIAPSNDKVNMKSAKIKKMDTSPKPVYILIEKQKTAEKMSLPLHFDLMKSVSLRKPNTKKIIEFEAPKRLMGTKTKVNVVNFSDKIPKTEIYKLDKKHTNKITKSPAKLNNYKETILIAHNDSTKFTLCDLTISADGERTIFVSSDDDSNFENEENRDDSNYSDHKIIVNDNATGNFGVLNPLDKRKNQLNKESNAIQDEMSNNFDNNTGDSFTIDAVQEKETRKSVFDIPTKLFAIITNTDGNNVTQNNKTNKDAKNNKDIHIEGNPNKDIVYMLHSDYRNELILDIPVQKRENSNQKSVTELCFNEEVVSIVQKNHATSLVSTSVNNSDSKRKNKYEILNEYDDIISNNNVTVDEIRKNVGKHIKNQFSNKEQEIKNNKDLNIIHQIQLSPDKMNHEQQFTKNNTYKFSSERIENNTESIIIPHIQTPDKMPHGQVFLENNIDSQIPEERQHIKNNTAIDRTKQIHDIIGYDAQFVQFNIEGQIPNEIQRIENNTDAITTPQMQILCGARGYGQLLINKNMNRQVLNEKERIANDTESKTISKINEAHEKINLHQIWTPKNETCSESADCDSLTKKKSQNSIDDACQAVITGSTVKPQLYVTKITADIPWQKASNTKCTSQILSKPMKRTMRTNLDSWKAFGIVLIDHCYTKNSVLLENYILQKLKEFSKKTSYCSKRKKKTKKRGHGLYASEDSSYDKFKTTDANINENSNATSASVPCINMSESIDMREFFSGSSVFDKKNEDNVTNNIKVEYDSDEIHENCFISDLCDIKQEEIQISDIKAEFTDSQTDTASETDYFKNTDNLTEKTSVENEYNLKFDHREFMLPSSSWSHCTVQNLQEETDHEKYIISESNINMEMILSDNLLQPVYFTNWVDKTFDDITNDNKNTFYNASIKPMNTKAKSNILKKTALRPNTRNKKKNSSKVRKSNNQKYNFHKKNIVRRSSADLKIDLARDTLYSTIQTDVKRDDTSQILETTGLDERRPCRINNTADQLKDYSKQIDVEDYLNKFYLTSDIKYGFRYSGTKMKTAKTKNNTDDTLALESRLRIKKNRKQTHVILEKDELQAVAIKSTSNDTDMVDQYTTKTVKLLPKMKIDLNTKSTSYNNDMLEGFVEKLLLRPVVILEKNEELDRLGKSLNKAEKRDDTETLPRSEASIVTPTDFIENNKEITLEDLGEEFGSDKFVLATDCINDVQSKNKELQTRMITDKDNFHKDTILNSKIFLSSLYYEEYMDEDEAKEIREKYKHDIYFIKAKLKCLSCVQVFSVKASLKYHMRLHKKNRKKRCPVLCGVCGLRFEDRPAFISHYSARHERCYVCRWCKARYASTDPLKHHVMCAHPFVYKKLYHEFTVGCDNCNKRFQQQASLLSHKCSALKTVTKPNTTCWGILDNITEDKILPSRNGNALKNESFSTDDNTFPMKNSSFVTESGSRVAKNELCSMKTENSAINKDVCSTEINSSFTERDWCSTEYNARSADGYACLTRNNSHTPEYNSRTPENNSRISENNSWTPENNSRTPENNSWTPENNSRTPENNTCSEGNNLCLTEEEWCLHENIHLNK